MKYVIPEDLLLQTVVDEMVILDSASGKYYTLDIVATRMINVFRETASIDRTLSILLGEYDVEACVLRQDLLDLLDKMVKAGLLRIV